MNPQQARSLVAETFPRPFDKGRFRQFSINLLNHLDEAKAQTWSTAYIKDAFKPHVSRFERLGTYTSPDDEKLDVLIVHLTNEAKLERARTAIRNFVADHLKTRNEKDAALVAFVSPTEQQWRFSYVKMEYAAVETAAGKVGVETRLTPARRFSYIVGEGESCHTAKSRFLALLQDTDNPPTLAQIEEAFSVEAVTKEFFRQYNTLFGDIEAALHELAAKDKTIGDELTNKQVNTVDFAKKLLGQIVFLYFLQKKGWLGVEQGKDWGTGPHDFLRRLAKGEYGTYENFFNDILEPLFYDTLATDRGHEAWCQNFKCRIPFLNGGLFEPLGDYDWRQTDITLPNQFFTNTKRDPKTGNIGTGILDVFDRYNFTVNEAEPLEKDVAIDPEMLGKVFENLIEENRRKGLGSFYTPREIVHYMCQESLINYLDTALNGVGVNGGTDILVCASDDDEKTHKTRRNLPHWTKDGSIYWITFRLADSLPQEKLHVWRAEREIWLKQHPEPWSDEDWKEYDERFGERLQSWLDAGHGSCALARPEIRQVVQDSLLCFDGKRLRLHAGVIMPNHVHLLLEPLTGSELSELLKGIKGASACNANQILGKTGAAFWMDESYDHIVRSERQYEHFRRCIAENPVKAKLLPGRFWLFKSDADIPVCVPSDLQKAQTGMSVPRCDIETLVHLGDQISHYEAVDTRYAGREMPSKIKENARRIDEKLAEITVCDPAVGSGAFPVGMMTEIVRARCALTPYFNDVHERTPYHFKRHAIQNCLYGVDIDPGAVEIARLRLWLSLVVDEEDVKQIKPLPNLDYKMACGNSLLGFPENLNSPIAREIETLIQEHFNETEHENKVRLKAAINEKLATRFANSQKIFGYSITFDLRTVFSEVFHRKNGFDVVIANPPYVRQEKIKERKPALKAAGYECFSGTADLLVYFYERGVKLLRPGGAIALITSNKYYRAGYGEPLRDFLVRELTLSRLIDFGDAPVFEAIAYASILTGLRAQPTPEARALAYTWEKEITFERIAQIVPERGQQIRQDELKPDGWRLESPIVLQLLEKLRRAGKPLGEYVNGRFYRGVLTGLNEAFVVDRATRDRLIREHKSSAEILKPFLRGRDVKRWSIGFAEQYLIKIESSENKDHPWSGKSEKEAENIFAATYPAIHARFEEFRPALKKREDQGKYFWELRSCAYWTEFEQPKIAWGNLAKAPQFSLVLEEYHINAPATFLVSDSRYLLGVLNSHTAQYYVSKIAAQRQGGFIEYKPMYVSALPIPTASPEQQKAVERLVDRVLAAKQSEGGEGGTGILACACDSQDPQTGMSVAQLEREIDRLVYALYDLTPEEIQIVESAAK